MAERLTVPGLLFEDGNDAGGSMRVYLTDNKVNDDVKMAYAGFAFYDREPDPDGRHTEVLVWELQPEGNFWRIKLTNARTSEAWAMQDGSDASFLVGPGERVGEEVAFAIMAALELVE